MKNHVLIYLSICLSSVSLSILVILIEICISARVRLGKKREEMSSSKTNLSMKNPSVAGNSTSSTTSTEDDSDQSGSESSDSEPSYSERNSLAGDRANLGYVSFESLFPRQHSHLSIKVSSRKKS